MKNKEKKRLKFKKFSLHPITSILLLILLVVIVSAVLSLFKLSMEYTSIDAITGKATKSILTIKNMLSYDGVKYIIGNAAKTFISFSTLSTLLITLMGVGILEYSGLANTFLKRRILKMNPAIITFIVILFSIFSSIVNEVGYVIMIPLAALIFLLNGRNPLAGICAAYAGVAFGYGTSFFVGATEISLIPYTKAAAQLIDSTFHVSLTSNLFIMIISCVVLAIVATLVTEKYVIKKIGRYVNKTRDELGQTKEIEYIDLKYEEQKKLIEETNESRGLKSAYVVGTIVIAIFVYMIIPGLPLSGMLLDMNEYAYVNQLFGANSYFQDGFTYMVAIFFISTGVAYGIASKTIKNDKDIIKGLTSTLANVSTIIVMIFFAAQLIAIFKETNIGIMIIVGLANIVKMIPLSGLALLIVCIIIIAISTIFVPTSTTKWAIFAPMFIPLMMQQNISPQYAQFAFRASESMFKGITPLLAYFVVYVGYLNIYNRDKDKPITLRKSLAYMVPYAIVLSLTWLIILLAWYIIGLPLGPGVYPTL